MKYLSITIIIITVLAINNGLGQNNVAIPYGKPLQTEIPLEYTFKAGSETVRKTVYVKLIIENFTAHHSEIKSFADGGLMGGFACDIVFNTWFSYSTPQGVYVDGEYIPFTSFNPQGINFNVNNVRFTWTQGNGNHSYNKFDMGSPRLPSIPKGDKPGYTGALYIELKDIVGDNGSCKKDIEMVKRKGIIKGSFLEIGGLHFYPPHELKKYLQERDEQITKETGYYTVNGFTNKVKDNNMSSNNAPSSNQDSQNNDQHTESGLFNIQQNNSSIGTNSQNQSNQEQQGEEWEKYNEDQRQFKKSQEYLEMERKRMELEQEYKRQQSEQIVNAVTPAVIEVFSYLGNILPSTNFATAGFSYKYSKEAKIGIYFEGGPGWKLTPEYSKFTLAIAPNLCIGYEKRIISHRMFALDKSKVYTEVPVDFKGGLVWGLGGNVYFDHARFPKWALNFSFSNVWGGISIEGKNLYSNSITNNKTSRFQTFSFEIIRSLGETNSSIYAVGLGIGFENNKYKWEKNNPKSKKDAHFIKTHPFMFKVRFLVL